MYFAADSNYGNGQLRAWITSMPAESLERLKTINENTGSARHVILTLAYAICDGNIRRLSRMITGLLLSRMRAERKGEQVLVERINDYMKEMHECIDDVTAVHRAKNGSRHACNRIGRSNSLARGH